MDKRDKAIEDFRIAEEVAKKLKIDYPGNTIFRYAKPQEIGIIGQLFRQTEKERKMIKKMEEMKKIINLRKERKDYA